MAASKGTYLVTGGMGCIGAWILYHLHQRGDKAVCFDSSDSRHRLDLLMDREAQQDITFVQGDLRDYDSVLRVMRDHHINRVIHLAALLVPSCRDNPRLCTEVNMNGTINVFEAARETGLQHVVYASTVAVYGPPSEYASAVLPHDAPRLPRTLYGVMKVANEEAAKVYWHDHYISSVALRPHTVYGLGRDIGMTSEPTKALRAAAQGRHYHIPFGGAVQFHYASDVARQFIAAADSFLKGAHAFNMGTEPVSIADFAELVMQVKPGVEITLTDYTLPFPAGTDGSRLAQHFDQVYQTPLRQGISETIAAFERLD
jgi:UDP-glucuronate 4-epimerase